MSGFETRLLIGGEQVAGDRRRSRGREPRHGGDARDGRRCRPTSRSTPRSPPRASATRDWAATPAVERGEMLHEVATRLRARTDELARVMTLEGGKPLIENSDEVGWTAAAFDYYAEIGRNFAGRVIPSIESTQLALVLKEPIGVVGCIVPWNYPLLLLAWKLAPALAAGNTDGLQAVRAHAALDADARRVLRPPAARRGQPARRRRRRRRRDRARTSGSTASRSPARSTPASRSPCVCAERVARINLELGGKDPFIVCADVAADVEVAARGGAWAAYLNAGQVCTSAERFYVMEPVYDDFVQEFVDYTESLVLGDPLDPRRTSARWSRRGQRRRLPRRSRARSRPARARDAAASPSERGHFFSPAVVTGAAARDRPPARGDVRAGGADRAGQDARRGDRARELDPLRARRERLHARPRDDRSLHARDQGGHALVQRPADRQRRRRRSAG